MPRVSSLSAGAGGREEIKNLTHAPLREDGRPRGAAVHLLPPMFASCKETWKRFLSSSRFNLFFFFKPPTPVRSSSLVCLPPAACLTPFRVTQGNYNPT